METDFLQDITQDEYAEKPITPDMQIFGCFSSLVLVPYC